MCTISWLSQGRHRSTGRRPSDTLGTSLTLSTLLARSRPSRQLALSRRSSGSALSLPSFDIHCARSADAPAPSNSPPPPILSLCDWVLERLAGCAAPTPSRLSQPSAGPWTTLPELCTCSVDAPFALAVFSPCSTKAVLLLLILLALRWAWV